MVTMARTVARTVFLEEMGERIRHARREQRIERADLARGAGITPAALTAIEGGTSAPSVWDLARIAEALDCTVEELVPLTSERLGR